MRRALGSNRSRRAGAMLRFVAALAVVLAAAPVSSSPRGDRLVSRSEAAAPEESPGARDASRGRRASATCASRSKRPAITAAYRRMRARWHRRAPRGVLRNWLAAAVKPLVIHAVNLRETFELVPDPQTGRFDAAQLAIARAAFRYHEDDQTTDVHPRVLELVYRAVLEFDAPYVTLVSGYRTTRATSRHNQGRAMDVVLPGVTDTRLSAYLRRQGFVGVGVYPLSGFVHVDVREKSFFWTDSSAPGRRSRVRRVAKALSLRYDREARRRGEEAVPDAPELLAGEGDGEVVDEAAAEAAMPSDATDPT